MPYTTLVAGTTITASWANANVRDQVVSPFTDSTARSSAISVPVAGMLSALTTTARLDIYNGSAWTAVVAPVFGGSTSWTPALTASVSNPTLGTGSSATGGYWRMGRLIVAWGRILFGSAGAAAGSGNYQISVPVTGLGSGTVVMGLVQTIRAATPSTALSVVASSSTQMNWIVGAGGVASSVNSSFTNNDTIGFLFVYEAATDG